MRQVKGEALRTDPLLHSGRPRSYEIPTTMDEHAVSIANGERFVERVRDVGLERESDFWGRTGQMDWCRRIFG